MTNRRPRFGAHMSIAGGPANALHTAADAGCDCLQIFVRNQRQWHAPPLANEKLHEWQSAACKNGITPVVAHGSYLLNLASPDNTVRNASIKAMVDELRRSDALSLTDYIFHPGAHMDATPAAGIRRIASALDQVHRRYPEAKGTILLETTAGQGTSLGHRFDQLAAILDRVRDPDRLGLCLDTCHLFAAGYDFRTTEGYTAMMDELDRTIGLNRVRCIHMNDSKRELGARVDRHEHIGHGHIGRAGFRHFVNDPRLRHVPMIIETPKGKDPRGRDLDKLNLRRLRSLLRRD